MFHNISLLERCFRGFVLPVLEYCSAVWSSAADTHFKLQGRAVSGARFLTGGVFGCDIVHHRSVAALCMTYKIWCNPMHSCYGALCGPCVPVRVTCDALVSHRYTLRLLLLSLLSVSLCHDLADTVFDGVGLASFKSRANVYFLAPQ